MMLLMGKNYQKQKRLANDKRQKISETSAYLTSDNKKVINLCLDLKMIRKFETQSASDPILQFSCPLGWTDYIS